MTLALAAMLGAVAGVAGTGEEGVRMGIRATARSSLVLLSLAFGASSLHGLWRSPFSTWLLRNRRQLGLSFAISHGLHLLGIVDLAGRFPERFDAPLTTIVFGGVGYLFVAAMAATSFDRSAAWLGHERWQRLHRSGCWFLWFLMAASFLPKAFSGSPVHLPFAALVLALPTLRILAHSASRRGTPAAQAAGRG